MAAVESLIYTPGSLVALAVWAALLGWPLFFLHTLDRWTSGWLAVAILAAVALSSARFLQIAPWEYPLDGAETMRVLIANGDVGPGGAWLWLHARCTAALFGWQAWPYALVNYAVGSLVGTRIVGMVTHVALLLGVAVTARLWVPRAGVPVLLAVLATGPPMLWASRWMAGTDLVGMQLGALALLTLATRSWRAVVPAGLATAFCGYTYPAALLAYVYPAWLLRRYPRRLLATYAVVALGFASILLYPALVRQPVWPLPSQAFRADARQSWPTLPRVRASVLSLWDWRKASEHTWSHVGGQTLSKAELFAAATALPRAIGLPWVPLIAVALAPDIVSNGPGGLSHRQIMLHLPLAILAAQAMPHPALGAALAVVIAIEGGTTWLWGDQWQPQSWGPARESLFPCGRPVDVRPKWCPSE